MKLWLHTCLLIFSGQRSLMKSKSCFFLWTISFFWWRHYFVAKLSPKSCYKWIRPNPPCEFEWAHIFLSISPLSLVNATMLNFLIRMNKINPLVESIQRINNTKTKKTWWISMWTIGDVKNVTYVVSKTAGGNVRNKIFCIDSTKNSFYNWSGNTCVWIDY